MEKKIKKGYHNLPNDNRKVKRKEIVGLEGKKYEQYSSPETLNITNQDVSSPETGEICSDSNDDDVYSSKKNEQINNKTVENSPTSYRSDDVVCDNPIDNVGCYMSHKEKRKHKHKSKHKKRKKKKLKDEFYKKYHENAKYYNLWYRDEIEVKSKYSVSRKKMKKCERKKKRLQSDCSPMYIPENLQIRCLTSDR